MSLKSRRSENVPVPEWQLLNDADKVEAAVDTLCRVWVQWVTGGATDKELDTAWQKLHNMMDELALSYNRYTELHVTARQATYHRYMWDEKGLIPNGMKPKRQKPHAKGCSFCYGKGYYWAVWQDRPAWIGCKICHRTGLDNYEEILGPDGDINRLVRFIPDDHYDDMPPAKRRHYRSLVDPNTIAGAVVKAQAQVESIGRGLAEGMISGLRSDKTELINRWAAALENKGLKVLRLSTRPGNMFEDELIAELAIGTRASFDAIKYAFEALKDLGRINEAAQAAKKVAVLKGVRIDGQLTDITATTRPSDQSSVADPARPCPACNGEGYTYPDTHDPLMPHNCYKCKGSGKVPADILDDL